MPTSTFNYTGGVQSFVVPADITAVLIECWGAAGGKAAGESGGRGGYSKGVLAVTPGETLNIYAGGAGAYNAAGWNGGALRAAANVSGWVTYGGGGASDVRQGGTALSNRKIVAGGGGGRHPRIFIAGGTGGGTNGGDGASNTTNTSHKGYGGTQSAGGAGGYGERVASEAGALGVGGGGGRDDSDSSPGGGGGYYGGGGGASYDDLGAKGGAGGGSAYIGGVTSGTMSNDVRDGHGLVTVTYLAAPGAFTAPTAGQIVDDVLVAEHGSSDGASGYTMEYTTDNGATWIGLGNSTSLSRTINTVEWPETTSAALRVRAYDASGLVSAWRVSPNFTISHGTYTPAMIL